MSGVTTQSGARVLRVLSALKGRSLDGVSNAELARSLGETPATINRVLNTLIAEGFATKLDSGRFALSVKVLQIAQAYADEMARGQARITELTQRVSAGAR